MPFQSARASRRQFAIQAATVGATAGLLAFSSGGVAAALATERSPRISRALWSALTARMASHVNATLSAQGVYLSASDCMPELKINRAHVVVTNTQANVTVRAQTSEQALEQLQTIALFNQDDLSREQALSRIPSYLLYDLSVAVI